MSSHANEAQLCNRERDICCNLLITPFRINAHGKENEKNAAQVSMVWYRIKFNKPDNVQELTFHIRTGGRNVNMERFFPTRRIAYSRISNYLIITKENYEYFYIDGILRLIY